MKLNTLWKTLNRDQRRAWNAWAKSNPVLLDDGSFRRVSGHKAMTMVLRNRAAGGEATNPTHLPDAVVWLDGTLSTTETGPLTVPNYVGFRCGDNGLVDSKWFVWATAPVLTTELNPLATLRFITAFDSGVLDAQGTDITPNLVGNYAAVHGDFRAPGGVPWDPPRKVWFRLHHYADGQLSPGRIMSGLIYDEN
jgi:hypothetical protein